MDLDPYQNVTDPQYWFSGMGIPIEEFLKLVDPDCGTFVGASGSGIINMALDSTFGLINC